MDTIDWVALGPALHVLLALAVAVYVSMNRNPSSAIAWVMAVVFIPLLGILFFLLVERGVCPESAGRATPGQRLHPGADPGRPRPAVEQS